MEQKTRQNTSGRPLGKRKTAKIEISLEPEIKDAFMNMCYKEGTNASVQLYQYIRECIKAYEREEAK